ncbi:hypothetical protein Acy02nite_91160 [Actinoplanes cyaneus]|uniref:Uncharacterized protein n=1 Tax=Actinoplanes cyaneus TaxID=52696 RepID=A0A919IS69_9ACTN|nr:hypothetical protein [Actinoplanes cyaneus]MCW2144385.1 hypothetical protein [Actinoplanes cyaneus]GID71235.1 hypothetical protein Acy02nite_91160 [Actinoplanes cyaneus]
MDDDLSRVAQLDPVRDQEPTPEQWARSRARIEEMMARSRTGTAPVRLHRPPARRLVIGLVAAAVLGVGGILAAPALRPGADTAYASWTAIPAEVTAAQLVTLTTGCARSWAEPAGEAVLAERRGTSLFLVLKMSSGALVTCFSWDGDEPAGADRLSDGHGAEPSLPATGRVSMLGGPQTIGGAAGRQTSALGRVGPGVTGVDIALPHGPTVRATVSNGWWAAWWPDRHGDQTDGFRIVVHTAAGSRSYRPEEFS